MSTAAKCVVLDTWAGRRYYAVELVGETPKKARVRILTPGGVMLPGRRYVQYGEIVLVPMQSGRIARYKVTSERFSYTFDDTGQRNWLWQFQGYEPANTQVQP